MRGGARDGRRRPGRFSSLDARTCARRGALLGEARHAAGQSGAFAAADVAAGIGRVAKHVLLPGGAWPAVGVLDHPRTL